MKTNILRMILMLFFFGLTACNSLMPTPISTPIPTLTPTPIPTPTLEPRTRTEVDLPDDLEGMYQVHVMYVVPRDGQSLDRDLDGSIENSVRLFNNWLFDRTEGYKIRFDTYQGRLDITYLDLPGTEEIFLQRAVYPLLEGVLHHTWTFEPNKIYLVYYEGDHHFACGMSAWPPNTPGQVAAVFPAARGTGNDLPCEGDYSVHGAPDATYPSFIDFVGLHEIFHALGVNPDCDASVIMRSAHTHDDPKDIMWVADEIVIGRDYLDLQLDPGHNDYYQHGIPGCPDLANSIFLDPLPENPELPPQEPPAWYRP